MKKETVMEYFDFEAKWKEIMNSQDEQLSEDDKFIKKNFKHTYQNFCKYVNNKVPKSIAETLMQEFEDPNYVLFVHKTGKVSKEELFKNGLKIFSGNNLEKTATLYSSNSLEHKTQFFTDIVTAQEYKNSKRAIILKIPVTSFFDYEPGKSKLILRNTDEPAEDSGAMIRGETQKILLPEYILGSVELENGKINSFKKNPNYKEIHNHSNDGLVCTSGLIENCILANDLLRNSKDMAVSRFVAEQNNQNMLENSNQRTVEQIKKYSKKEMLFAKFNQMAMKIKNFFTKDKNKEEVSKDVDK